MLSKSPSHLSTPPKFPVLGYFLPLLCGISNFNSLFFFFPSDVLSSYKACMWLRPLTSQLSQNSTSLNRKAASEGTDGCRVREWGLGLGATRGHHSHCKSVRLNYMTWQRRSDVMRNVSGVNVQKSRGSEKADG